jgi:hypothetical protein
VVTGCFARHVARNGKKAKTQDRLEASEELITACTTPTVHAV